MADEQQRSGGPDAAAPPRRWLGRAAVVAAFVVIGAIGVMGDWGSEQNARAAMRVVCECLLDRPLRDGETTAARVKALGHGRAKACLEGFPHAHRAIVAQTENQSFVGQLDRLEATIREERWSDYDKELDAFCTNAEFGRAEGDESR
jgi:hypothetical protein